MYNVGGHFNGASPKRKHYFANMSAECRIQYLNNHGYPSDITKKSVLEGYPIESLLCRNVNNYFERPSGSYNAFQSLESNQRYDALRNMGYKSGNAFENVEASSHSLINSGFPLANSTSNSQQSFVSVTKNLLENLDHDGLNLDEFASKRARITPSRSQENKETDSSVQFMIRNPFATMENFINQRGITAPEVRAIPNELPQHMPNIEHRINMENVKEKTHNYIYGERIKIGLMHNNHPNEKMTEAEIEEMRLRLLQELDDVDNLTDNLGFDRWTHRRGWVSIICINEATKLWLLKTIQKIKPYELHIRVLHDERIKKYKFYAHVPILETLPTHRFLLRLSRQNFGLDTSDWYVVREFDKPDSTKLYVILVDAASNDLILRRNGYLSYNFSQIKFAADRRIPNQPTDNSPLSKIVLNPLCLMQKSINSMEYIR